MQPSISSFPPGSLAACVLTPTKLLNGYYLLKSTATGHGLDGLWIESRCRWDYPDSSRSALRHTQLPMLWVPAHSQGYRSPGVVDYPTSSSAEVNKRVELYIYSPRVGLYGLYYGELNFFILQNLLSKKWRCCLVRRNGSVLIVTIKESSTEIQNCVVKK